MWADHIEHLSNNKNFIIAPLPVNKHNRTNSKNNDRQVDDIISNFLGNTVQTKTEKKELALRESIFSDDYWITLRRTRIYRTSKPF